MESLDVVEPAGNLANISINNVNKNVSISGFIKTELYHDMTLALFEHDYTRVCYVMAELACTKNETASLFCFVVDHMSKYGLGHNVRVYTELAQRIKTIDGLSKRNVVYNPVYQKLMCEVVMITALYSKKMHPSDFLIKEPHAIIHRLEPYVYNFGDKQHKDMANFATILDPELFKMLNLLYNRLRHKDKDAVHVIANYLLGCGCKEYTIASVDFYVINHLKPSVRNDVVWCLWQVIHIYITNHVKRHNKDIFQLLNDMYNAVIYLYSYLFQKKHRLTRIGYLFFILNICCEDPCKLRNKSLKTKVVNEASRQAKALFDGILPDSIVVRVKKPAAQMRKAQSTPADTALDTVQPPRNNCKYDYLKMYIGNECIETDIEDEENGENNSNLHS